MNAINNVRRRWAPGAAGKILIGGSVIVLCCVLTFAAAAPADAEAAGYRAAQR